MKRNFLILALMALLTLPAIAQGGAGDYEKMSVKAGKIKGNIATGQLDSLTGGAHIVLKGQGADKPDLPIKASTIFFTWKEGQNMPTTIKMSGNVDIKHPSTTIKSDKADWNLETGELVFTGSPVMESPTFGELHASKISINLETGEYDIDQGEAEDVPLMSPGDSGGDGGAPIPGELAESDVTDWAGLIDAIKAQGTAEGDNPGKQVLKQLDEQTRGLLESVATPQLVENKGAILKKLNGVIRRSGMFSRPAWESQGITLSDEIEALLAIDTQTSEQQVRQNRLLLQAAYPTMIAAL